MKLNIGPKIDLFKGKDDTYNFKRYDQLFTEDLGRPPSVIEFHVLLKNIDNPEQFERDLENVAQHFQERNMQGISFHYPDEQIPSEVRWKIATIKGTGMQIRKDDELPSVGKAQARLYRTIELIAAQGISPSPILVTHKGGVQLEDGFFRDRSVDELRDIREEYMGELLEEHKELLALCGDRVQLGLENTAAVAWDHNEGYICEQAFEHFEPRLSLGGVYVLDTAHATMCSHHKEQEGLRLRSLESVESEQPPSLNSLKDHIRIAGPYTKLIHLGDARGVRIDDEGLPIRTEGSIIDWPETVKAIEEYSKIPNAVIEIRDSQLDYEGTIGASLEYLQGHGLA